jgi:hypothetical protein
MATLTAAAEGITLNHAQLREDGANYRVAVEFTVRPSAAVEQALEHGVVLSFVSEFSVIRQRQYWLDETIMQDSQTIRLSYNALTRQYCVSRGEGLHNFAKLDDALAALGEQVSAWMPATALARPGRYVAAARLLLDLEQLPKPMQINALMSADWTLDSGWLQWDATKGFDAAPQEAR